MGIQPLIVSQSNTVYPVLYCSARIVNTFTDPLVMRVDMSAFSADEGCGVTGLVVGLWAFIKWQVQKHGDCVQQI